MSCVALGNDSLDMKLVFRYEQNEIYDCENTIWRENTYIFFHMLIGAVVVVIVW